MQLKISIETMLEIPREAVTYLTRSSPVANLRLRPKKLVCKAGVCRDPLTATGFRVVV